MLRIFSLLNDYASFVNSIDNPFDRPIDHGGPPKLSMVVEFSPWWTKFTELSQLFKLVGQQVLR